MMVQEDEGDLIRFVEDGKLDHPHAVRFTPNSVIAADATAEHRKVCAVCVGHETQDAKLLES